MTELNRPTASEVKAVERIRAILEELCGDADRAAFHVEWSRKDASSLGLTRFMDYLFVLAYEIPHLVVDPDWRLDHYSMQRMIDDAVRAAAGEGNR